MSQLTRRNDFWEDVMDHNEKSANFLYDWDEYAQLEQVAFDYYWVYSAQNVL